ncbi:acetate uptake transporter [Kribbella sp.]|uniref:acetate uptake transporter n=1 Tax=Kribbella sp. TaxID=1871183 RepID=UPI002D68F983|nr:acetate uptake transporter [Kribbella sp.]HZX03959.1 acetate uptake transporter [Kribbella sp.]
MADTQRGAAVQAQGSDVVAPAPQQVEPSAVIADPAPLGLAGFAMTTFVLSWFNAKLISNTTLEAVVLPLALFYGGLAQFLAGMWEFRKGNTFGALAFTSFGAFWLSFAAYVKFVAPGLGANASTATGLFLLVWTIFTAYMTVAAARVNAAVLAVFVFLTLTFLFLTIGAWAPSSTMTQIGGWLGLVTAVVAWYTSLAGVTNFTWKRNILPVFPLTPAPHR